MTGRKIDNVRRKTAMRMQAAQTMAYAYQHVTGILEIIHCDIKHHLKKPLIRRSMDANKLIRRIDGIFDDLVAKGAMRDISKEAAPSQQQEREQ